MLFSATFVAPWHIGASDVADVATFAPLSSAEGLVNAREYAVRPNETRSSARGADDVVAQARPCPVNPFSPPRWVHPGIGMVLKAFGGICPARVPARLDKGHATREGSYTFSLWARLQLSICGGGNMYVMFARLILASRKTLVRWTTSGVSGGRGLGKWKQRTRGEILSFRKVGGQPHRTSCESIAESRRLLSAAIFPRDGRALRC